ncbi:hypothetical protein [Sediminibacterium sp.]|uniref:hypothetical protein n=1 Tax=Sediminibacterium sp. TaxID=1917865 RepID=UPI0027245BC3|nr:hypothetical protein [Sediminibacterium sp.]MDO9156317.1 hypothetical protein [Sediminibacterium sp.]MDP2420765.1 hypothetical protein [Sediminibacterium sp.]
MKFPFAIGLNSNNEPQYIDLAQVPLLMVSYSFANELQRYFSQIRLAEPAGFSGGITAAEQFGNFLISNSRHLPTNPIGWSYFLTDEPESGTHTTRTKLLNAVLREMQLRQRIMKQKRITNFEKYHALNLWNNVKLPYKLLLIDDIWNLVKAKPVSLSIQLFRIILNGPAVGIHTIIGSNISYRNLLQHLIELNPSIRKMLQEKYGIPEPTQISSIAQELILTPDHLVFYKKSGLGDLEKYYPLIP